VVLTSIDSTNSSELASVQVKDWRLLLKDIHRVLRPGGMLIFGELDPRLTAPEEQSPATEGPASRSAHFFEVYRAALSSGGVQTEAITDVADWLSPGDELWASQPGSGFHSITRRVWEVPLNSLWHPDPLMQRVGALMAVNFCEFIASARPVILSQGFTDLEVDQWAEDMRKETRDPMNNAVIRYHLVCAYKL
jgi:SAM-dependent methyltransferase